MRIDYSGIDGKKYNSDFMIKFRFSPYHLVSSLLYFYVTFLGKFNPIFNICKRADN